MRRATVEERSPGALDPGVRAEIVINLPHAESQLRRNAALSEQAEQDEALLQTRGIWIARGDGIDQPGGTSNIDGLASGAIPIGSCELRDQRGKRHLPSQRELDGYDKGRRFRSHDEVLIRQPEKARWSHSQRSSATAA